MPTFAYLIKGRAKSEKKSLFCWFESKSDSRAEREIMNILEDADITTGRGADYQLPTRIDFPVFDDLPPEGKLDDTWFDRYELAEDNRTCRKIVAAPPAPAAGPIAEPVTHDSHAAVSTGPKTISANDATFGQSVLGAWLFGACKELTVEQCSEIHIMQHDMEATYPQNVLLALGNIVQLKHCFPDTIFYLIEDLKKVWPATEKSPELGNILSFAEEWIQAHNYAIPGDGRPSRQDVTVKWIAKHNPAAAAIIPPAGNDRPADIPHTLDTLDVEIACALLSLSMDVDIYQIPGAILRRAKEMIAAKESPWREWSAILRDAPSILDVSRADIFSLIQSAEPNLHLSPFNHWKYISNALRSVQTNSPAKSAPAPDVKNLGAGKFSIDGLEPKREGPIFVKNSQTGECSELTPDEFNQLKLSGKGFIELTFEEYLDMKPVWDEKNKFTSIANQRTENPSDVPMEEIDHPQVQACPDLPAGEGDDAEQNAPALTRPRRIDILENRLALVEKKLALLGDIGLEFRRIGLESLE